MSELERLLTNQGGVATSGQLLAILSRRELQARLRTGELTKLWTGIYGRGEPDLHLRLRGLDLRATEPVAVCLSTAATLFGFDTEDDDAVHILDPLGHHLRNADGLVVHRREGAQLTVVDGRPCTTAPWTAVETARALRRPRALACLDAALRSGSCDPGQLARAADRQPRRRGIVQVRELVPLASALAESPMESEARLAMHDGGLPTPVLQHEVIDRFGRLWRLDFAWPEKMVAVEYDGFDWHSSPEQLGRDREKRAALTELGWRLLSIVSDDVRRHPWEMNHRIGLELLRAAA